MFINSSARISPLPLKRNIKTLFLSPCTANEVKVICSKLSNSKACGNDEIMPQVLKESIKFTCNFFAGLINEMFTSGIFPEVLKEAKVTPIFKKGDASFFANYRPISVLNFASKILEKSLCTRIVQFLEKTNVLNCSQYGFRKNHLPVSAISMFLEKLHQALDKGEPCIALFLDIAKAFDSINYPILHEKLEAAGIRGISLDLVKDYLKNRKQSVYFENVQSKENTVTCRVPQGSIIGPILFILYINDLCEVCPTFEKLLFADDSTLFKAGKDLDSLIDATNSELCALEEWIKANKLKLNVEKSHWICFSKQIQKTDKAIKLNKLQVRRESSTSFLGVVLDEKLRWQDQIHKVATKISQMAGVLSKLRKTLPLSILTTVYTATVQPHLQYCLAAWGSGDLHPLKVAQNRVL